MLEKLRARLNQGEEGFTLIELMVVVLIIAILLAIAIPSFLGARGKAQDRAAQSNARNALTAEKTFYTDNQVYTDNTAATYGTVTVAAGEMAKIEPSLTYVTAAPTQGTKEVQLQVGNVTTGASVTAAVVCVTTTAANGNIFVVKDVAAGDNAGTYFAKAAQASCDDSKLGSKW